MITVLSSPEMDRRRLMDDHPHHRATTAMAPPTHHPRHYGHAAGHGPSPRSHPRGPPPYPPHHHHHAPPPTHRLLPHVQQAPGPVPPPIMPPPPPPYHHHHQHSRYPSAHPHNRPAPHHYLSAGGGPPPQPPRFPPSPPGGVARGPGGPWASAPHVPAPMVPPPPRSSGGAPDAVRPAPLADRAASTSSSAASSSASAAPPSSSSPRPTTDIAVPHPHDVLCGRGGSANRHVGNANFRSLVSSNRAMYVRLTKRQKMQVARSIVDAIVSGQAPGGRFLQRDVETGLWFDIGRPRSLEKTSQALREKPSGAKRAAARERALERRRQDEEKNEEDEADSKEDDGEDAADEEHGEDCEEASTVSAKEDGPESDLTSSADAAVLLTPNTKPKLKRTRTEEQQTTPNVIPPSPNNVSKKTAFAEDQERQEQEDADASTCSSPVSPTARGSCKMPAAATVVIGASKRARNNVHVSAPEITIPSHLEAQFRPEVGRKRPAPEAETDRCAAAAQHHPSHAAVPAHHHYHHPPQHQYPGHHGSPPRSFMVSRPFLSPDRPESLAIRTVSEESQRSHASGGACGPTSPLPSPPRPPPKGYHHHPTHMAPPSAPGGSYAGRSPPRVTPAYHRPGQGHPAYAGGYRGGPPPCVRGPAPPPPVSRLPYPSMGPPPPHHRSISGPPPPLPAGSSYHPYEHPGYLEHEPPMPPPSLSMPPPPPPGARDHHTLHHDHPQEHLYHQAHPHGLQDVPPAHALDAEQQHVHRTKRQRLETAPPSPALPAQQSQEQTRPAHSQQQSSSCDATVVTACSGTVVTASSHGSSVDEGDSASVVTHLPPAQQQGKAQEVVIGEEAVEKKPPAFDGLAALAGAALLELGGGK